MLPYEECPTSLSCYILDVWQFIDWRAIAITTCFWIAAMVISYLLGGKGEVKQALLGALKGSLVTLLAIGLILLGLLVYSPWQRYQALKDYAVKTIAERDKVIEQQKTVIKDLEAKLQQQVGRTTQSQKIDKKWNAWRPDKDIFARLREPVNEHTNAHIIFFNAAHRPFAERLASAFEITGWKVNFNTTAQGPYNPHNYEGVEVKGFNRHLVETVVSVLKKSGIDGVKSQIESTQLNPNNMDYQTARNRISVIIGYEE